MTPNKNIRIKSLKYALKSVSFEDVIPTPELLACAIEFEKGHISEEEFTTSYLNIVEALELEKQPETKWDLESLLFLSQLFRERVCGNFDVIHLKEINKRIFRFSLTAGQYRSELKDRSKYWRKMRPYTGFGMVSIVYSHMLAKDRTALENQLGELKVEALNCKTKVELAEVFSRHYAVLDFIHPFPDGNSRTYREFFRLLALEAGFTLDWTKVERDQVCLARDFAVNAVAMQHYPLIHDFLEREMAAIECHTSYVSLKDLFKKCLTKTIKHK